MRGLAYVPWLAHSTDLYWSDLCGILQAMYVYVDPVAHCSCSRVHNCHENNCSRLLISKTPQALVSLAFSCIWRPYLAQQPPRGKPSVSRLRAPHTRLWKHLQAGSADPAGVLRHTPDKPVRKVVSPDTSKTKSLAPLTSRTSPKVPATAKALLSGPARPWASSIRAAARTPQQLVS